MPSTSCAFWLRDYETRSKQKNVVHTKLVLPSHLWFCHVLMNKLFISLICCILYSLCGMASAGNGIIVFSIDVNVNTPASFVSTRLRNWSIIVRFAISCLNIVIVSLTFFQSRILVHYIGGLLHRGCCCLGHDGIKVKNCGRFTVTSLLK